MKLSYSIYIIAAGLLTLAFSCKKGDTGAQGATGPTGPSGPAGPSYTGAISGHVDLVDQYGSKVLNGLNSVQISLNNGTAISPDPTGYYIFGGITTGDYILKASASGFGATMVNKFQYLADTLARDIKLSAIPNFAISSFTTTHSSGFDTLFMSYTADTRARQCIIFVNNNAVVNNIPANFLTTYVRAMAANTTKSVNLIPAQDLYELGFSSGSTVYLAVYSYVVNDVSVYEDLASGKNVYNCVSNPVLTTAIVP